MMGSGVRTPNGRVPRGPEADRPTRPSILFLLLSIISIIIRLLWHVGFGEVDAN